MNPFFSIIIPVYNAEDFIGRCLESILCQSYENFEIVIVNDGSTDNSAEIIEGFSNKDNRIRLFHKENGGVSSARNYALRESRGEWILFCDADDEICENALSIFYNNIDDNVDFIMGDYIEVPHRIMPKLKSYEVEHILNNVEFLFTNHFSRYGGYLWNKLFRKNIIDSNSLTFNENIFYNEDRLFILEYLSFSPRKPYRFINQPVYKHYVNNEGAMANIKGSNFQKFETDFDAFIEMNRIAQKFKSSSLSYIIAYKTFCSYETNRKLNRQYGNNNFETNIRLQNKLKAVINNSHICQFYLRNKLMHIKNKLKSLISFN